jgi:hypothetical protein
MVTVAIAKLGAEDFASSMPITLHERVAGEGVSSRCGFFISV